ncbi:MAG TPA: discoidin domain-containing protein [Planctomycetota bacterium]|nr:discoidin domain-containing protein [Planctomycetota bacterium]OQC20740.1 MAG: F5/8 type C domain protein [Planctomycetes bacterium ADurb.Bin069]HNR98351.1 discoidin domain-containing protein [Planctomycetota bacterium]HNU24669.1 discoidin domain-containing protein [Planctomycetota bacterium]HOE28937.1 discoidin domain-containing protein [Planctomycetota bacterium]
MRALKNTEESKCTDVARAYRRAGVPNEARRSPGLLQHIVPTEVRDSEVGVVLLGVTLLFLGSILWAEESRDVSSPSGEGEPIARNAELKKTIYELLETLIEAKTAKENVDAFGSLVEMNEKGVTPTLLAIFEEAEDDVVLQCTILRVLGARKDESALPALLALVKVGTESEEFKVHPDVIFVACTTIGMIGTEKELPELIDMFIATDGAEANLSRAIDSILHRLEGAGESPVVAGVGRAKGWAKAKLLVLLRFFPTETALQTVRQCLSDPDPVVVSWAIHALGYWQNREPLPDLLRIAEDSSNRSRQRLALSCYIDLLIRPAYDRPAAETVKLLEQAFQRTASLYDKESIINSLRTFACKEALVLAQRCSDDGEFGSSAKESAKKIKEVLQDTRCSVTASPHPEDAEKAIDGDITTRWSTGEITRTGCGPVPFFQINLGGERALKRIILDGGDSSDEYPRSFKVSASFDGVSSAPVLSITSEGNPTLLAFSKPIYARYVWISLTGDSRHFPWSIHELLVEHD